MSGSRGSSRRDDSSERYSPATDWPPIVAVNPSTVYIMESGIWPNAGSSGYGVSVFHPGLNGMYTEMIALSVPSELRQTFDGMIAMTGVPYYLEARISSAPFVRGRPAEYILQQRTARSAPPSRTPSPPHRDIGRVTAWPATVAVTLRSVVAVGGTVLHFPGSTAPPAVYDILVRSQDANIGTDYFRLIVPIELHASFLDVVWETRARPNLEARSSVDVDASGRPRAYTFQQRTSRSASASRTPSPPTATGDLRTLRARSHSTDAGRRIGVRDVAQASEAQMPSPPRGRPGTARSVSDAGPAVPPSAPSPPSGPHQRTSSVVTVRSVSASYAGSPRSVSGSPRGPSVSGNGRRNSSLGAEANGSAPRQASPRTSAQTRVRGRSPAVGTIVLTADNLAALHPDGRLGGDFWFVRHGQSSYTQLVGSSGRGLRSSMWPVSNFIGRSATREERRFVLKDDRRR